jgi:hypothetical protein
MRPLVVAPHTKKLAASSQKSRWAAARASAPSAFASGLARGSATGGSSGLAPYGRRPRSDGRSRTTKKTIGMTTSSVLATTTETERQPLRPSSEARIGRNTSCPVAVLAVRMPMTRPRRAVNHRWTIVAPRTIAVVPVPSPTSTPQKSTSCHGVRIAVVRATPVAASEGSDDRPPDAGRLHDRRGERSDQAVEDQVDRDRRRDEGAVPAELLLERHDEHAWRRAHPGGSEKDDEDHRGDLPGVVDGVPHETVSRSAKRAR